MPHTAHAPLRAARVARGMTQKQLAYSIGVMPSHIGEMEAGKRSVSKRIAHLMASILLTTPEKLRRKI